MTTQYYNISVTVPESDADRLRKAIGDAGAGSMGKYSHGSFSTKSVGRGIALDGAHPKAGTMGQLEEAPEEKIEVFCKKEDLENVLNDKRYTFI